MSFCNWLINIFRHTKVTKHNSNTLREFVYLDEVSLLSMLSSLKGEITDSTSEQNSASTQAELKNSIGTGGPSPIKSDVSSRYQTSNSCTIQTSRKATVQSWFREFYNQPNLRLIEPKTEVKQVNNLEELLAIKDQSIINATTNLQRGALVEFKVRMEADPVFRLGTMATELTGMANDYPELFEAHSALAKMNEAEMVNKILQRLLAGLIPIRATAIDYSVITIKGNEFITHNDAISKLNIDKKPLEIVGITEHLAYWRDIRRVLFSEGEYTMLCRIGKTGIHTTWAPVKLAELFSPVAPDLMKKINSASRTPFEQDANKQGNTNNSSLERALIHYKEAILSDTHMTLNCSAEDQISNIITSRTNHSNTATEQRKAFNEVNNYICQLIDHKISPERDLEMREASRRHSGLKHFPSKQHECSEQAETLTSYVNDDNSRLLDVEVISIYW